MKFGTDFNNFIDILKQLLYFCQDVVFKLFMFITFKKQGYTNNYDEPILYTNNLKKWPVFSFDINITS